MGFNSLTNRYSNNNKNKESLTEKEKLSKQICELLNTDKKPPQQTPTYSNCKWLSLSNIESKTLNLDTLIPKLKEWKKKNNEQFTVKNQRVNEDREKCNKLREWMELNCKELIEHQNGEFY